MVAGSSPAGASTKSWGALGGSLPPKLFAWSCVRITPGASHEWWLGVGVWALVVGPRWDRAPCGRLGVCVGREMGEVGAALAARISTRRGHDDRWYPRFMATNRKVKAKAKPASGSNGRSAANGGRPARSKVSRERAAANALASVRAEGLDPHVAEPLLGRWAREEITDAQLDEGILRIAARESLADLLGPVPA